MRGQSWDQIASTFGGGRRRAASEEDQAPTVGAAACFEQAFSTSPRAAMVALPLAPVQGDEGRCKLLDGGAVAERRPPEAAEAQMAGARTPPQAPPTLLGRVGAVAAPRRASVFAAGRATDPVCMPPVGFRREPHAGHSDGSFDPVVANCVQCLSPLADSDCREAGVCRRCHVDCRRCQRRCQLDEFGHWLDASVSTGPQRDCEPCASFLVTGRCALGDDCMRCHMDCLRCQRAAQLGRLGEMLDTAAMAARSPEPAASAAPEPPTSAASGSQAPLIMGEYCAAVAPRIRSSGRLRGRRPQQEKQVAIGAPPSTCTEPPPAWLDVRCCPGVFVIAEPCAPCAFFAAGRCPKGEACPFCHMDCGTCQEMYCADLFSDAQGLEAMRLRSFGVTLGAGGAPGVVESE